MLALHKYEKSDASVANEGETYSWRRRLILVVKMASATLYEGL